VSFERKRYMMQIKRLTGLVESNCFIVFSGKNGIIIDPGAPADEIGQVIEKLELQIDYIILTHVHYDHVLYVDEVRKLTGGKVAVHEAEKGYLGNPFFNGSILFGRDKAFNEADIFLKDGDILSVNDMKIEIIHTPGHTPGSICIKVGSSLFSGDTLFRMSVGRTDLGNGDPLELAKSLDKLMELDGDVTVYPGHGSYTTIGLERDENPFMV